MDQQKEAATGEGTVITPDPVNLAKGGVSRIGDFDIHPVAEAFPLVEGTEFDELCDSVKGLGLVNPIILLDGKVIDGRNRLRAAVAVGMTDIRTEDLPPGTDAIRYVMAQNIERRHLTPAQRAAITIVLMESNGELARAEEAAKESRVAQLRQGDVVPSPSGDGNGAGRVSKKVAELAKVSQATAERVLKLKRTDPEKFEEDVQAAKTGAKMRRDTKSPGENGPAATQDAIRKRTIQVPLGDAAAAVLVLAEHYELTELTKVWPAGKPVSKDVHLSKKVPAPAAASTPSKKGDAGKPVRWRMKGSKGRVPNWVLEATGTKNKHHLKMMAGDEATFTKGGKLPPMVT
jgi:ParB-like chromosome segregation protein Spo0J